MSSKIRPSVWDDSEPEYRPYYKKIRGKPMWVCPPKEVKNGYRIKTYKLEGHLGDGLDLERARQCRLLTRELLNWMNGDEERRIAPGTWGWAAQRFLSDGFSPFAEKKASTKDGYRKWINKISAGISDVEIADTDFERMSTWKKAMRDKGRSTDYIKKWFTHFGLIISYAIVLGNEDARKVKAIRSEMRIANPPKRTMYADRNQIELIVAAADAAGDRWLSLALLIRYETLLRGVDVYGQWVSADEASGGIRYKNTVWIDGLTWEMFDRDVTEFRKIPSKTEESLSDHYIFDLMLMPEIRSRLLETPKQNRVGPVITVDDGLPPRNDRTSKAFKRHVRAIRAAQIASNHPDPIPEGLRISDARSGGITEAKGMVDRFTLRDAAQHTQVSTTDRYVRGRSEAANRVIELRAKK